jgi:hypothetical protein
MGMFDNIRCEYPLPDGWKPGDRELQTKDLDCALVTHVITKQGRLLVDMGHDEPVPKEERPYPDDEGLRGFLGSIRHISQYVDSNYHGYLNFYGSEGSGPTFHWHEYRAKFTDGQLVKIDLVEDKRV